MVFVCLFLTSAFLLASWTFRLYAMEQNISISILSVECGGTKHIPVGNFLARDSWKIKWGCSPETLGPAAHNCPHVVSAQSSSTPPAVFTRRSRTSTFQPSGVFDYVDTFVCVPCTED